MKEESTFLEAELKQVKRIKLEKSRLLQDFLLSKQKIRSEDSILINEFVSESSTDFLKPACIKSEFDQLASEKDLQRYTTISSKK